MPRRFPPEFRQHALWMLEESMPEHETEYSAIRHVSTKPLVAIHELPKSRNDNISDLSKATFPGHSDVIGS
jgi:transposase